MHHSNRRFGCRSAQLGPDERRGIEARQTNWLARACAGILLSAAAAIALPAQTFTTLFLFDGTDGGYPAAALVQGVDGNLYGTTASGGEGDCSGGCGTVFKITTAGTLTSVYSFCEASNCPDGEYPYGALVQAGGTHGKFYGTTSGGGTDSCSSRGCGTVFAITPGGKLTTLRSFDGTNGEMPYGGLVEGRDGKFYGTTYRSTSGGGTVFGITFLGDLSALYTFSFGNGAQPWAGLVQGSDGNFYGTTTEGGSGTCTNGCGTVFEITPEGTLTTLHNFTGFPHDGDGPLAGLIQATDGSFYGTTEWGGANNECDFGCGTVFKMTPGGKVTVLHSFCSQSYNCADGEYPEAGLVQATDGNFYGTTAWGGGGDCTLGCGTVFKITPDGTLTTLHSFSNTDGRAPIAALIQDTDGDLYGTAACGGANTCSANSGTIFRLSMGLGPFVETWPSSAKVGKPINILGSSLTGATNVTFNGAPATFTVLSASLITATVPEGATTGTVQVVTPGGTLSSNVPFRVFP